MAEVEFQERQVAGGLERGKVIVEATWDKSIEQFNGEREGHAAQVQAWLTECFGERCEDFCALCENCQRWKAFDRLFQEI